MKRLYDTFLSGDLGACRQEVFRRLEKRTLVLSPTRTPEGRKDLVRARARTFATALQPKSQRVDRWV